MSDKKVCTKPDCFPYCDCGSADDYVPATPSEDDQEEPCPVCGNEVRGQGGYLSCECPAPKPATPSEDARDMVDTTAWEACNPGCDPEFNGEKGRHCVCDPAKAAMSAKKANSINPEMVDVVGYTTAGMLRISKDLPLTGRIGAKCKPDERWNVPLMTVAQHSRIVAEKDAEIALLNSKIETMRNKNNEYCEQLESLRAQPARQVGGDEREAMTFADILLMWNRRHEQPPIMVGYEYGVAAAMLDAARAALAPAAVDEIARVKNAAREIRDHLKKEVARLESDLEHARKKSLVVMPEKKESRQFDPAGWNAALDAVASLNRRAIPVGLIERIQEHLEYDSLGAPSESTAGDLAEELRALLGKDDDK